MPIRNNHWYDLNDQRKYPLADVASGVSDGGDRLPAGLIADLRLRWPKTYGKYGFLTSCAISPKLVTVLFAATTEFDDPNAPVTLLAGYTGLRTATTKGQAFALQSFCQGAGGFIVFGGVPELPYTGRFSTPARSMLSPRAAWGVRRPPVRTLGVENAAQAFSRMVNLSADLPLEIVKESREIAGVLQEDVLVFRLQSQAQPLQLATRAETVLATFAGPCGARVGAGTCGDPEPIVSLNGVTPDCDGIITLDFRGCALVGKNVADCGVVLDCETSLDQVCAPPRLPTLDTGELPYEVIDYPVIPPTPPRPPDPPPGEVSVSLSLIDELTLPYCESFDTYSGTSVPARFSFVAGSQFTYVTDDSPEPLCADVVSESTSSSASYDSSSASSDYSASSRSSQFSSSASLSSSSDYSSASSAFSSASSSSNQSSASSQFSSAFSSSSSPDSSAFSSSASSDFSSASSAFSSSASSVSASASVSSASSAFSQSSASSTFSQSSASSLYSSSASSASSLSSASSGSSVPSEPCEPMFMPEIEWKLSSAEVYDPELPVDDDQIITVTSPSVPDTLRFKRIVGFGGGPEDQLDLDNSVMTFELFQYRALQKVFQGYSDWDAEWTGNSTLTWGAQFTSTYDLPVVSGGILAPPVSISDSTDDVCSVTCARCDGAYYVIKYNCGAGELEPDCEYWMTESGFSSANAGIEGTPAWDAGWAACFGGGGGGSGSASASTSTSASTSVSASTSTSVPTISFSYPNDWPEPPPPSSLVKRVMWDVRIYKDPKTIGWLVRGVCRVWLNISPIPLLTVYSTEWVLSVDTFALPGSLHLDDERDSIDPTYQGIALEAATMLAPADKFGGLRAEADIRWFTSTNDTAGCAPTAVRDLGGTLANKIVDIANVDDAIQDGVYPRFDSASSSSAPPASSASSAYSSSASSPFVSSSASSAFSSASSSYSASDSAVSSSASSDYSASASSSAAVSSSASSSYSASDSASSSYSASASASASSSAAAFTRVTDTADSLPNRLLDTGSATNTVGDTGP